jgi:tetratricopeptide (TPR) repeat protein
MKYTKYALLIVLIAGIALFASCKPINIFSPFVNPDKMGNDAKLDAGYNSLADGDYDEAIDYFTDVIQSSSGDELTDAYIGRASAYLNKASPNLDEVVGDLVDGTLAFDDPSDVITSVVQDDEYTTFFDNIENAADDYNAAVDNSGSDVDQGILVEAYQTNMMAATSVGSKKIAQDYNTSPWNDTTAAGLNAEYGAIVNGANAPVVHPYNIDTWSDTTPSNNGLRQYVAGTSEATTMLGYLQNAFDELKALEGNPPSGMDITSLKDNINGWVTNGLNKAALS